MELLENASEKNDSYYWDSDLLIYRLHPGSLLLVQPLPTPTPWQLSTVKDKKTL